MKEWFKARNLWGAAILSLSDAEAGRLAKALWSYTMSGEEQNLSGAEKGIFAMIQMQLSQDDNRESEISEKRSASGAVGAKQKQANLANARFARNEQANLANASFAKNEQANLANACNENQNKNKKKNQNQNQNTRAREDDGGFITDEEAIELHAERMQELNTLYAALEDAGFDCSKMVIAKSVALYDEYGLSAMLNAIEECVLHGVCHLAYLTKVLQGGQKAKRQTEQSVQDPDDDFFPEFLGEGPVRVLDDTEQGDGACADRAGPDRPGLRGTFGADAEERVQYTGDSGPVSADQEGCIRA